MKVFKLEFRYFSGVDNSYVEVKIIAQSMEELKTAFLSECYDINQSITAEELFEKNVKFIIEEELTFPIINRTVVR